uniref:Uncharacterized protein n=1 Tax=Chelonoidis abingdonii TaxID=106734 RepID=A0A8C0HCW5_CHEAB
VGRWDFLRLWGLFLLLCPFTHPGRVPLGTRLSYPSTEKVCMDLSNVKSSMLFSITLETKIKTYKLLDRFVWEKRQLKCFSFPVSIFTTIQLSVRGGKSKITEKKQVLIQRANNSTFVQTDKPLYMPGQLVRFRIVTLNSNFIPLNDKVSNVAGEEERGR